MNTLFDQLYNARGVNVTADFIDYDGTLTAALETWARVRGVAVEHQGNARRVRVGMAARIVVIRIPAVEQAWRPTDAVTP